MKTKPFAIFFICLMMCGILAGCGQSDAEKTNGQVKEEETAREDKSAEGAKEAAEAENEAVAEKGAVAENEAVAKNEAEKEPEFDTTAAERSLKEMSNALSGFLWASMMKEAQYSPMESGDIKLELTDEEKIRAAVLAGDPDGVIDSTFVLGMGGFSEDKNADAGPDGDGFHGVSVSEKEVDKNCLDLFGTNADWGELPPGPMCDLFDAVLYRTENDSCALIIDKEIETETVFKNQECTVTEENGKYIGKVNVFWGYWGELEQKPGYSNYVATYTLEPNDGSKYGMVITSISLHRTDDDPYEVSETGEKSLAKRMTGKYSFHHPGRNGEDELYVMAVVNFGDNLYAFCGQAMLDDSESCEPYTFWACEFIPYDAREMSSTDGDSVRVNELCFSIMSNAGKYWDSGHAGTITYTADGLVFEGFDHDGFLVPDYDDSRLFLKDERVEDAFSYLKHDEKGGDKDLQGLWALSDRDADLYIKFTGSDMYMYKKCPDQEVFFAAGRCDLHDGSFDFAGNLIENGGMPLEFSADYKAEGDSLHIVTQGSDVPSQMPDDATFKRISEQDIHVTTMDEIVFNEDSFGAFGQMEKEPFYGLWVDAFKDEADAKALVAKLKDKGLPAFCVYSCDWENLNKDPYYCVTIGRSDTQAGAEAYIADAKEAGYTSAYVKYTGGHR